MHRFLVGIAVCATLAAAPAAQPMPKYGVTVQAEKGVDFSKVATYAWTPGQPSPLKEVDAHVVAAVDRELGALGLKQVPEKTADVLVTYYSVRRTDVDLKGKTDAQGLHPDYAVGTLMVAMLEPASRKRLLRLRIDKPIETDQAHFESTINAAVGEMFVKYPTRQRK